MSASLLEALYGDAEGYRFGIAIEPGEWAPEERHLHTRRGTFEDTASLEAWVNSWSLNGWNAYHSCALFSGVRRKAEFALGAKAFWLDLDVGEGKPFATQPDAAKAVFKFCRELRVPIPTFVSSGVGVHCYWILDHLTDHATWLHYAARLKQACTQMGLAADPTRTADIASILRTPGTLNQKTNPPTPVRLLQAAQKDVTLEELQPLLTSQPAQRVAVPLHNQPLIAAAQNIYSYDPAEPSDIADECAQVRLLRDWPETRAAISEPLWRGILGVLKHALDGEEIAHEWSSGHTAYNHASTQSKINGWSAGPATCAYFASHNPDGCRGCPHASRISSPIQLGRRAPERNDILHRSPPAVVHPGSAVGQDQQAVPFPAGFAAGPNNELMFYGADKKGNPEAFLVSRSMVYLDRVARGELRSDKHFYVLKHCTQQDGMVTIELPAKEFWGSQGLAALAGKGPVIEDADLFRRYMREAVYAQQAARKTGMMYEQCGWKENDSAFLVGTTLYRAQGARETVQGTAEITYRGRMLGPRAGGSLAEWTRCADDLFGIGREAQSFALLASLGAPLIRFLSADEGGAIVSLVSRGSGRGKTTALAGVTSVWGDIRGLQLANADTSVSKGLTFGALGNLPVVFDELAARESQVVREFIEMFTNGRDKMRGTQEGEIKHTLATWQTILITASNSSLVDTITAEGGSTATTMRVIELPVALPSDAPRNGDALKSGLHKNWGYAGDAFIRHLTHPNILAWARETVVHAQQQIISQHGFKPEHRFWARTLACCGVAGVLATQLKLISFPVGPILQWVLEHLRQKVVAVEQEYPPEENAIDILVSFVNEHISEMLVCADAWRQGQIQIPRVSPKSKLTLRYNLRPGQLLVLERELRAYLVKREYPFIDFVTELQRVGISGSERKAANLGAGTDFSSGPQRCIEINTNHPALSIATAQIERELPTYQHIGQGNVLTLRR